jgi:hypothetical protein
VRGKKHRSERERRRRKTTRTRTTRKTRGQRSRKEETETEETGLKIRDLVEVTEGFVWAPAAVPVTRTGAV